MGVGRSDLALRVQRAHGGLEVREFLDGILVLALIELHARVGVLVDEAGTVLLDVLANEGGVQGRRLQIVDLGLALIEGLGSNTGGTLALG